MSGFVESPRFPDEIAAWLVGGRRFMTTKVINYGGAEYRNAAWSQPLGIWTVDEALRTAGDSSTYSALALYRFVQGVMGDFDGFRLKAPLDNADNGGGILGTTGLAIAATLSYQMYKKNTAGSLAFTQIVNKPLASGIVFYDNGSAVSQPGAISYNSITGIATFVSQPTVGHALTWTGSYDVPVRLDGDGPNIGLDLSGGLFNWQSLILKELRNP